MTLKQLMEQIERAREHYSHAATRECLESLLVRLLNEGVSDDPPAPEPSADRRFSEVNERIEALTQHVNKLTREAGHDRECIRVTKQRVDALATDVAHIEHTLGKIKAAI